MLRSGFLAQGKLVEEFEEAFARYIGTQHAVAVSSGTAALHLSLLAHGIGPGDEVIIPAFTFIATANSVLATGAKPVLVDIDQRSFNLSIPAVASAVTDSTRAIIPVHLFGCPADMPQIMEIAEANKLVVIEDAAQAHGASINGRKVGSFGTGCFSFYPTKNMTCGEGGIVTTNDAGVAEQVRLLRNHGMRGRYDYVSHGMNFRMNEMQAAIGLEQLKKLPRFNETRRRNASLLSENLNGNIICPSEPENYLHVFNQYSILVQGGRDEIREQLRVNGIGSEIYYPEPLNKIEHIRSDETFPVAEDASKRILSLPVHPGVSETDVALIASAVNEAVSAAV